MYDAFLSFCSDSNSVQLFSAADFSLVSQDWTGLGTSTPPSISNSAYHASTYRLLLSGGYLSTLSQLSATRPITSTGFPHFSADGAYVINSSSTGARLTSTVTWTEVARLPSPESIESLRGLFLPAANTIMLWSGSSPHIRYILDYDTWEVLSTPNITLSGYAEIGLLPGTSAYYVSMGLSDNRHISLYDQATHTLISATTSVAHRINGLAFSSDGEYYAGLADPFTVGSNIVRLGQFSTGVESTVTNISGKTFPYERGRFAWSDTQQKFIVAGQGHPDPGFFLLDPYTATIDFVPAAHARLSYDFIACPNLLYEVYGTVFDGAGLPASRPIAAVTNARYADTALNQGFNPIYRMSDAVTGAYRVFTPNTQPVSVVAFDTESPPLTTLFHSYETPSRRRMAVVQGVDTGVDIFAATAEVEE